MKLLLAVAGAAASLTKIPLITFDAADGTTFKFTELSDPVMGGQSDGTWELGDNFGVFDGTVKDVPSLSAPGFIKVAADGTFADVSALVDGGLVLKVRTSTPEYTGFKITLVSGTMSASYACSGGGSLPFSRGCYKAAFAVSSSGDFAEVVVPFSSFSDKWSPATGEQTTTCADDADVCLTAKKLASITRVELWAEGADGDVHLEVESIYAALASSKALTSPPPAEYNTCSGPVQSSLRYGADGRTEAVGIPVQVNETESLAEAVCCDSRVQLYAEPQFLFEAPDISLFTKLEGETTFFDSVCGLPVFAAPRNRTMAEFQEDTMEHGWPSFRTAEIIFENVITDKATGFVTSKCGTHLGSFLPDAQGDRWCIDLVCVSGNSV